MEKSQAEQRPLVAARMPQVKQRGRAAARHQRAKPGWGKTSAAVAVERNRQRRHAEGEQQKAGEIEAPRLHGVIRHQPERRGGTGNAHRQVD